MLSKKWLQPEYEVMSFDGFKYKGVKMPNLTKEQKIRKQFINNRIEELRERLNFTIEEALIKFQKDCYRRYKVK